jgi:Low-density lipoprotein receptor domain class A/Calcium-binding EGF domain
MKSCSNGWCINEKLFCDGHEDCEDGFDEMRCSSVIGELSNICDIGQFQCTSDLSKCVEPSLVCNGYPDCPKGEDEKNCTTCSNHMFECDNDNCVLQIYVCDSHDDCEDGSDEKNCFVDTQKKRVKGCDAGMFICSDGSCVNFDRVCDGIKDCSGGDDEGGMCSTACVDDVCQQKCTKTPKGSVCSCEEGYQLASAGDKTCVDIDECKTLNPCSQMCLNTIGSFRCSCYEGFVLSSDKTTCNAKGAPRLLLYKFFDQIRKLVEAPRATDVLVNLNGFRITDFDVDLNRGKILLSVAGDDELIEVDMKTEKQNVLVGIPTSNRITHDWITGNTYLVHYPDDNHVEIHVCNVGKQKCGIVKKLNYHDQIPSIQVDPINKHLFYVQMKNELFHRPVSRIMKARLDGSDAQMVMNDTHITALALDIDQKKVYFTEMLTQSLQVVDYNGEYKKYFAKEARLIKKPIALSLFENHAYILNQLTPAITKCKLYGDMECRQMDLMENNVQRISVVQQDNTCESVCIPADLGYKCLCQDGTFVLSGAKCFGSGKVSQQYFFRDKKVSASKFLDQHR